MLIRLLAIFFSLPVWSDTDVHHFFCEKKKEFSWSKTAELDVSDFVEVLFDPNSEVFISNIHNRSEDTHVSDVLGEYLISIGTEKYSEKSTKYQHYFRFNRTTLRLQYMRPDKAGEAWEVKANFQCVLRADKF